MKILVFSENMVNGLQISGFKHKPIEAAATLRGEIWKRSFISAVRLTVHTNPSRKRSFSKRLFRPVGGIWKHRVCIYVWTKNIVKTELFKNYDVTIITWFPYPSFPETSNQVKMIGDYCVFTFRRFSVDGTRAGLFESRLTLTQD